MGFLRAFFRNASAESKEASAPIKHTSTPPIPQPIQRAVRVQVTPLHDVEFEIIEGSLRKTVRVANISVYGLGLVRDDTMAWPATGEVLHGILTLQKTQTPLKLKIRHHAPRVVGCEFMEAPAPLRNQILSFFEVELAGVEMIKVRSDLLQKPPKGEPHWYRGGDQAELYFVTLQDQIESFHMSFLGWYLQASERESLRMGRVMDDDSVAKDRPAYKPSDLIRFEPLSDPVLNAAARLILSVQGLSEQHRKTLLGWIKNVQRTGT